MFRFFLLILSILLVLNLGVNAQFFTESNDLLKESIAESRKDIYKALEFDEIDKIQPLIDHLEAKVSGTEYQAFWIKEKWILEFFIGNYTEIFEEVLIYDSLNTSFHFKLLPPFDNLSKQAHLFAFNNKEVLLEKISKAELSGEEKDFLALLLYYLFNTDEYKAIYQSDLNDRSEIFLDRYLNSKYNFFINQYIREFYPEPTLEFGFDFSGGYFFNSGNLNNYIDNTSIVGFGIDFKINRFKYIIRINASNTHHVKEAFSDNENNIWPSDLQINFIEPELFVGYILTSNERFESYPFLGPAWIFYLPAAEEGPSSGDQYDDHRIGPKMALSGGISFDYTISRKVRVEMDRKENARWYFRGQIGYIHPYLYKDSKVLTGDYLNFKIGFGGTFSASKRVY